MALVHYDSTHRLLRTTIKQYLTSPANLQEALPMQDAMADKLVKRLRETSSLTDLSAMDDAVRRAIGIWSFEISMVGVLGPVGLPEPLKVNQGEPTVAAVNEPSEQYYETWHHLQRAVLMASEAGVSQLYDMLPPWLLRVASPLIPRLRDGEANARALGVGVRKMHADLLARLKDAIALAEATGGAELAYEGMMAKILRSEQPVISDAQIKTVAQTLMDAAADTTSTTLMSCLLALVMNPECLRRAREEVDAVCAGGRMPTAEDVDKFPYLMACICEVSLMLLFCVFDFVDV